MSDNKDQVTNHVDETNALNGGDATLTETAKSQPQTTQPLATGSETEVVYSIEDLPEEKEYSAEEFEEMANLYEQTLTDFVEGELVVGKILAVNDKEVAVDIGFKSEGVIPIEEFSNPAELQIGDDIEVYLDNVEDKDGQLVLSKKKADFLRDWEKVIDAYDKGEVLQGVCMRRIKGGIVVNLMGVDAFLPGSQIDVKPIRDFDALIGQTMDFKIVKINELRKNIVVSHRALIEESMKEQRAKILENLEKGQVLEGMVKNITDFGVFLDLGGVDGLLHINDLSWGRVNHPSEILALDEKVKVEVLDFNEVKDRISLGLKQLQPHPWENVKEKYHAGDVVKGKVVNISDYGTFIELEKGVEGLIHISEMSWSQHIKHPSKILSLGEMVEAKILSIDLEERKISLGLKQLEPDPWTDIETKYPAGTRQRGVVRNLTNFGAFVELEEGVDGLIHISDLSWTKKVRHPGEVVKKGEEIEVVVLNIDKDHRRISLGYKQTVDNPWDTFAEAYKVDTRTKAKIVRMIEKGVIVELPLAVDAFVPLSQLHKEGIRKPSDGYKVGDELDLVVIEFNKENKKIILSEKQAQRKEATEAKPEVAKEEVEALEVPETDAVPEAEQPTEAATAADAVAPEAPVEAAPETEAEATATSTADTNEDAAETEVPSAEAETALTQGATASDAVASEPPVEAAPEMEAEATETGTTDSNEDATETEAPSAEAEAAPTEDVVAETAETTKPEEANPEDTSEEDKKE
ncbi:MAG: 30S ribosomal protein S1 [bacterium]